MKKIILLLLICLTVIFFKNFQNVLLDFNFSWTLSYLLPYIFLPVFAILLLISLKKWLKSFPKFLVIPFYVLILLGPFALGFALNPIYEGDLSKEGRTINSNNKLNDFNKSDFVVLTIPNCPFCRESSTKMNLLQKRNPDLRIKYIVCSSEKKTKGELRNLLTKKIKIDLAKNLQELVTLAEGKFPCFIKTKKGRATYVWNNSQLGTRAMDWLEDK